MARTRLDSAEKKRRRRQRDKENQEKKRAAKAKRGRPSLAEEERKEQRRRTYLCYNEKRRSSQESFAPSSQDSSQHPATNASISRQQNHQRLIVETVGADESDDEDELPDTNAILQASQQSIHAERMEAVVGGPSERMDIDAAAAASVPIPPPPDAFVGAWNDPLFLGYLQNHRNNPNPGVVPQVQAPPWVAASENRHAQVDCGVADRTAPVAAAASVPPPPPEARRPIADWLAAIPDEEVYTPAVLGRRRRSVLSQNEAEENIRESSRLSQQRRRRAREVNLQLETVPPRQELSLLLVEFVLAFPLNVF